MTTIATDRKTMAGDSQINGPYTLPKEFRKVRLIKGALIGCSGRTAQAELFFKWWADRCPVDAEPKVDDNFEALVVFDGRVWAYDIEMLPIDTGVPAATGSGMRFAMGAMMAGASPKEAVEIAMKLDPETGGRIRVVGARR